MLVFPSAFASPQALARSLNKMRGIKVKISLEEDCFLVCSTQDPVKLASMLEDTFGIDTIAIARKIIAQFPKVTKEIADVGSRIVMPGEKFFVNVKSDRSDYVSRDIEFASTGMLTENLAKKGSYPAKNEQDADRTILAFIGKKFAYICLQVNKGLGGLPLGSLGKIVCSLYDPLSFLSCYMAMKAGFRPEITLLYVDRGQLVENAKLVQILVEKTGYKDHLLKIAPIHLSGDNAKAAFLKHAIAAKIVINQPSNRVSFPFIPEIHPLWFIESFLQEAILADKIPYMPLMFLQEKHAYEQVLKAKQEELAIMTLDKYPRYRAKINNSAKLSIKNMKKLQLHVGPNYLHNILDRI